jgi:hypothetical protein
MASIRRFGRSDVEPGSARCRDVKAPTVASCDDGKRSREVRALALGLVLLEHDGVQAAATLVEGVKALAETDDVLAPVEAQCESNADWTGLAEQPLDAVGYKLVCCCISGEATPAGLPARGADMKPGRCLLASRSLGNKPVPQVGAGPEWFD